MVSKRRRGFPRARDGYVEYMRGLWLMKEGYRASKEGYSSVKRGPSGRVKCKLRGVYDITKGINDTKIWAIWHKRGIFSH